MFEDRTYESLLDEALKLIPNDIDKQEGSIIRTALSPCIYKLAEYYIQLDNIIDLVSGDTASGEYLDRIVADYGVSRKSATYSIRKITTTGAVSIGNRWSINETTYETTKLLSENIYSVTCEQSGVIGNIYNGKLEALDNVGQVTATLTDIITPGNDKESDDDLRERFYEQVQSASTSGNVADYKKWALKVTGVGGAKVFPLWSGPGTVKIVIVDSDKQPVDDSLIKTATEYIETVRPIGATVTVVSGAAKTINISATISLASGYTLQSVTSAFTTSVTAYFQSISFDLTYVSLAKLGTILLATEGVTDYRNLLLNNSISNVTLADDEIPLIGTVELGV